MEREACVRQLILMEKSVKQNHKMKFLGVNGSDINVL